MRTVGRAIACVLILALVACGDSEEATTQATTTSPAPTTSTIAEPPSGPIVRICDRRLATATTAALREQGFRGRLGSEPVPSGTPRLSVCELAGSDADGSISLDAASDAVRRYRNRVTETAQFCGCRGSSCCSRPATTGS